MERVNLNDVALLVATVQAGSLSAAALALDLPKSHVSRRLSALETALGSKLLDRSRSGVRLNELGERFYQRARLMVDCADQAVACVGAGLSEPQGLLRLSLPLEIHRLLLEGRLADFLRRYPAVQLEVHSDNRPVALLREGVDLALRVGPVLIPDVVARPLGTFHFGLYAAPGLLAGDAVEALAALPLLIKSDGPPPLLQRGRERRELTNPRRVAANDAFQLATLARAGLGLAFLPNLPGLTAGLERIWPDWQSAPLPFSALYYKNRGYAPTVRAFIDWLQGELRPELGPEADL